jgi:hypothetical protein
MSTMVDTRPSVCQEPIEQRSKVGFGAWLYLVVTFQRYYYFSSSVFLFQILDSLSDLAQPVTPIRALRRADVSAGRFICARQDARERYANRSSSQNAHQN